MLIIFYMIDQNQMNKYQKSVLKYNCPVNVFSYSGPRFWNIVGIKDQQNRNKVKVFFILDMWKWEDVTEEDALLTKRKGGEVSQGGGGHERNCLNNKKKEKK